MFNSDKPILSRDEDLLGRANFAKQIARSLLLYNSNQALTVSLCGKWGSGKTSVINLIVSELESIDEKEPVEKNKPITIRFEPWVFSDDSQLLNQFFVRVSSELQSAKDKFFMDVGQALEKYGEVFSIATLIPGLGGTIATLGKQLAESIGVELQGSSLEKDISKQKENVINLLSGQPRRILVIIDDIDRLSNEKIKHVFQLVTAIANFPNVIYLLAFDREIVAKALSEVQKGDGNEYLGKVIQVPLSIPDIKGSRLNALLFNRLDEIIRKHPELVFKVSHWRNAFDECIKPYVRTIRDVNRLCNVVSFKISDLAAEVDFTDLVSISVLELFLPILYLWVKDNKYALTGEGNLQSLTSRKRTQKEWEEYYLSELGDEIKKNLPEQRANVESTKYLSLLVKLFPHFSNQIGRVGEVYDLDRLRDENRIGHPEKFDRYFDLDINDIGLRSSEIRQATMQMEYQELMNYLVMIDKNELSYDFLEEVKARASSIPQDRLKIMASALFETLSSFVDVKGNILNFHAKDYAGYVIIVLLKNVHVETRFCFIKKMFQNADVNRIQSLAVFLRKMQLSHGRFTNEYSSLENEQLLSLEQLYEIERLYCLIIKSIHEKTNILDFEVATIILFLIENIDSELNCEVMRKLFENDLNKVKFITHSVKKWNGSNIDYEIVNEYEKYFSPEESITLITSTIEEKKLSELDCEAQYKVVAFYLFSKGEKDEMSRIPQEKVISFLEKLNAKN